MPLVIFQLLDKLPRSIICVEKWARLNHCIHDGRNLKTCGNSIEVESLRSRKIDIRNPTTSEVGKVASFMRAQRAIRSHNL